MAKQCDNEAFDVDLKFKITENIFRSKWRFKQILRLIKKSIFKFLQIIFDGNMHIFFVF